MNPDRNHRAAGELAPAGSPGEGNWERVCAAVLDSVSSLHSKRAYAHALAAFRHWCIVTGATGFTRATVQRYRAALEASGLAVLLSMCR